MERTRYAALIVLLWLVGCASAPTIPPLTVTGINTVPTPTSVPCVTVDQIEPLPAAPEIGAVPDIEQRVAWLGLRIEQLRAYGATARALLLACSKAPIPAPSTGGTKP